MVFCQGFQRCLGREGECHTAHRASPRVVDLEHVISKLQIQYVAWDEPRTSHPLIIAFLLVDRWINDMSGSRCLRYKVLQDLSASAFVAVFAADSMM